MTIRDELDTIETLAQAIAFAKTHDGIWFVYEEKGRGYAEQIARPMYNLPDWIHAVYRNGVTMIERKAA